MEVKLKKKLSFYSTVLISFVIMLFELSLSGCSFVSISKQAERAPASVNEMGVHFYCETDDMKLYMIDSAMSVGEITQKGVLLKTFDKYGKCLDAQIAMHDKMPRYVVHPEYEIMAPKMLVCLPDDSSDKKNGPYSYYLIDRKTPLSEVRSVGQKLKPKESLEALLVNMSRQEQCMKTIDEFWPELGIVRLSKLAIGSVFNGGIPYWREFFAKEQSKFLSENFEITKTAALESLKYQQKE